MSAIAGIYEFEARPVDLERLLVLGDALIERGPDGGDVAAAGTVGMVYRAFHTNAESRGESQPLLSRSGQMLCWDGRLDNRDELAPLLRSAGF
jgi:asparagine synthetase B (glutamine-hydrolysing)